MHFVEMMNNERISNEMNDQIECQYPSNSHDSLLQSDHDHCHSMTIVDELTRTNQQLSSTFHSKDSALGLSDEYLNHIQINSLTHDEQIPSCSLLEDKSKFHFHSQPQDVFEVYFFNLSAESKVKSRVRVCAED